MEQILKNLKLLKRMQKRMPQRKINFFDNKISEFVNKLCGLTDEEIKIIEGERE